MKYEPLFPTKVSDHTDGAIPVHPEYSLFPGITIRDFFAATMPEPTQDVIEREYRRDKMANPHNEPGKPRLRTRVEIIADLRYEYADVMMKRRKQ